MRNYNKEYFINSAVNMVKEIKKDFSPIPAGIRSQLLNKQTNELVMDFVVKKTKNSTHILNAVSPAFTCSFAFAKWVINQ